jgi:hypothetical protein
MTDLLTHLKIPFESRSLDWEKALIPLLKSSRLTVMSEEPLNGPDGWPYLHVRAYEQSQEPAEKILQWLSERGIGLLLDHEEQQDYPDYVLTWGMLWYLNRNANLLFDQSTEESTQVEIEWDKVKRWGEPNQDYLPESVRKILREFLAEQEILTPRYLVFTQDGQNFDLAFSIESLGNPPEAEHQGILEALSWFLPPHYSLMLLSETNAPKFILL